VELDGGWKLCTDPDDKGVREEWFQPAFDDRAGLDVRAGQHWEPQGLPHYNGIAWYRIRFQAPAQWVGRQVTAVFEGVDDSYHCWLNGKLLGNHGDPQTGETVWLVRTTIDLGPAMRAGDNQLTLRVVDHQGAGGLHRRVFVTDGPVDATSELIN
jgi:beta-galactosidase/beta-glucuronidase